VRHHSSKDLLVHSRKLEGTLPLRVKCIDGFLHVMVLREVPTRQCLPSYVCHCHSTSCIRGWTRMLANHLLPDEDLHSVSELHAPRFGDTLDPVL
jgi:ribulose-5-phosphate 4-epimerase/fuculose-1-phosphate aldolase